MNKQHGALLRHEFAYVLGQMRVEGACDALEATLDDRTDHVMVRHECGEALGAIGAERSLKVLERNMRDADPAALDIGRRSALQRDQKRQYLEWKADGANVPAQHP